MIVGAVTDRRVPTISTDRRVPTISIAVGSAIYSAVVDTGFNGDLELPETLRAEVRARLLAQSLSLLAGGVTIVEDLFLVAFPFDGQSVEAEASFVEGDEILIGTKLLSAYRLEIDFVKRTVQLEKV